MCVCVFNYGVGEVVRGHATEFFLKSNFPCVFTHSTLSTHTADFFFKNACLPSVKREGVECGGHAC